MRGAERPTGTLGSHFLLKRRHARADLDLRSHLAEYVFDTANSGENVELIDVAHVRQANDLAFEFVLAVGKLDSVLRFEFRKQQAAIDTVRHFRHGERSVGTLREDL